MAYHFDARADSSDEGGVDLNSFKAGSASSSMRPLRNTPAPVASMAPGDASDDSEDRSVPNLAAFQSGIKKRKRASELPTAAPSFQAINSASIAPDHESTFDLGSHDGTPDRGLFVSDEGDEEENKSQGSYTKQGKLMPVISRKEARNIHQYVDYRSGGDRVLRVLKEAQEDDGTIVYKCLFDDYHEQTVPFEELLGLDNGQIALDEYGEGPPESETPEQPLRGSRGLSGKTSRMTSTRPASSRARYGMVSTIDNVEGSDVDMSDESSAVARTRGRKRKQDTSRYISGPELDDEEEESEVSEDELSRPTRSNRRDTRPTANDMRLRTRRTSTGVSDADDDEGDSDPLEFLRSDVRPKRRKTQTAKAKASKPVRPSERQSARSTRHVGDMEEVGEEDIWRSESEERVPAKPKVLTTREIFKPLPRNDEFRMRHNQYCDTCGQGSNFAPLIDCQGCSLMYHKNCLGHRTGREHLVTKVGEGHFVLQCRRCVNVAQKKDSMAPDQGKCQECHQRGKGCRPFRKQKTPGQEQRERDENDGVDPITQVDPELINNSDNVLFRCVGCFRAFHFEHLPSRSDMMELDLDADAEQRFREYSRDWKCKECVDAPAKVSGIIAWKPLEEDVYDPATGFEGVPEDEKAYLVRWEGMSYFRARWVPGPWVWGITTHMMRKAFAKREDAQHPKMRTEDAIPEDFLRTDIVLDIKYTSIVDIHTEEVDKARIREVDKALIKYKGLNYEDAVWEAPPGPDDGERWSDFVQAYNDWVAGRYCKIPKPSALKTRLEKVRKEDFSSLEKHAQPDNVESGKLMEYQVQGLNWLYYKWFTQKNAILADEMGLGKTIQIIAFLATLVQDHHCFPFLVVVPNSTCPNWRREIKRWAPSLRVVAYYGSATSRDMALRYELFPDGSKDLRCHIVVTSYDAAADENCRKFFKHVPWQGLIVDEGQRLKNDKTNLYTALGVLKAPFKILLTGTPLQNNTRELFNLLHFLDDSYNPSELEKEYEELDQAKITELHDLIRPFFLRRTKAQVLTFLPPMSQIIVPVSMTLVQKKLYKSILAKNPDLMKAIFSTESNTKPSERGSLSNILMQLRKCLCHPFVYNSSIEDRRVDHAVSHRNLVDASSKLQLLELLLPKLQERGHRVLIFSQFLGMLDMVEDFMDGMQLRYARLDGGINALTKQKRIDEFNAPDSQLFAFLLSTRAGGVGINLATADTVIILDPDFNPHQDIQALSRAHRIGQNRKVLCFQLVTRASAEERIMQIGKKKLALDHVLIQELDADDADQNDLVAVLRHGASELFEDNGDNDIVYDSLSIDGLLDRSHMENTQAGADKSAESTFAFARVWANSKGALEDATLPEIEESAPDPGVWANILKERERVAAEEAAAKAEAFGRGRRARQNNVDYTGDNEIDDAAGGAGITPVKKKKKKNRNEGDESDTDFQAEESDDDDEALDGEHLENGEVRDLAPDDTKTVAGNKKTDVPIFRRAHIIRTAMPDLDATPVIDTNGNGASLPATENGVRTISNCRACQSSHPVGSCPLKLAGVEHCNLCGIAHYGHARVCPHIQSETQVRAMLEALKHSNEPEHLVNEARRYLRGLKGSLVQNKKLKEQRELAEREQYNNTFERQYTHTQYQVPSVPMGNGGFGF